MGKVIRVTHDRVSYWQLGDNRQHRLEWPSG